MKLWFCLTDKGRERLSQLYKELTGKDWIPPEMSGTPDIEDLKKIAKIMKESPSYVLEKQGREG